MSRYELHTIHHDTGRRTQSVAFQATGDTQALVVAHRLAGDEPVELWQHGRRVCHIQRSHPKPQAPAI